MRISILAIAIIAVSFSGCGGTKRTIGSRQAPKSGQISQVELRDELDRFQSFFTTSMKELAEQIRDETKTRRSQRTSLQMQSRILEALHAMASADDSVVAFFDTWALVIRLRLYVEEGNGQNLYGTEQPKVVAYIKSVEADIDRIGRLLLKPEQFEQLQKNLYDFARQHPITGTFSNLVVYATQEKKEEAGVVMKTLSIPMAPIRAMEGVDKTGDAILKIRDSVDRFTDVTEQLPESTRWQMSVLVDDFEDSEMTQSFLTSLNEFSQSSAQLVDVMESMPAQLRTELLTVLEQSDQTQHQLQTTMQTAAETAVQLEKTLGEFQTAALAFNETTSQATEAGVAWQRASDSIQDLVMLFKNKQPRPADAPPPFGMHDFNNMLTNAGQTADNVSAALGQLQQTIDSGSETGIQQELRSLIDHIAKRLFQLILAIFVLICAFRYVKKKLL